MMRILALLPLLLLAIVDALLDRGTPATIPANLTPTPEPTVAWDGSDLSVTGFCDLGKPTFVVTNGGTAMQGPTVYRFTHLEANEANCTNEDNNEDGAGVVQLDAGQSVTLTWPDMEAEPPYSLCVLQRPGHPNYTWSAFTVSASPQCVTASDPVAEPPGGWRVFIPTARR